MAPFFFGIFAAIAISGYFSHGTMTYDLLANPRRWKIQVSRIASLCLLSLATAVVASLANYGLVQILNLAMNRRALQPSFSRLLLSFFLLLMSSLIYCLIGSGIGFLLTTTAASIFAYLGIMWGNPRIIHDFGRLQFLPHAEDADGHPGLRDRASGAKR